MVFACQGLHPLSSLGHLVVLTHGVRRACRGKGERLACGVTAPGSRLPSSYRHLPVAQVRPRQRGCPRRQCTPCHLRLVTQGQAPDVGTGEGGAGHLIPGAQEGLGLRCLLSHPALRPGTWLSWLGLSLHLCQMEPHKPACLVRLL